MSELERFEVRLRQGFSDRMGMKKQNTEIQITDLDDRTRIALINIIDLICCAGFEMMPSREKNLFLTGILSNVYIQQVRYEASYDESKVLAIIYDTIKSASYDDVLTVVEYLANQFKNSYYLNAENPFKLFNMIFEREFVGYRFVNELITPISNKNEIKEIEEASNSHYKQVNNHLNKSLQFLSNRDNPDYENSIKESISAVECICSIIIGKATTLGSALDKLEKEGLAIHKSMKSAFEKLYGYTSDGTGIRHAGKLGGPQSTFEEAKFMLVSCCAFVNYLLSAMSKYN